MLTDGYIASSLQECQKLAAEVVEAKHSGAMAVATALDQLAKAASAIQELRNEIVHLKLSKEELVKNYEAQVALTQGQLELPAGRIAERKASTNVSAQGHIDSSALISECNFHSTIDVNDEIKVGSSPSTCFPLQVSIIFITLVSLPSSSSSSLAGCAI